MGFARCPLSYGGYSNAVAAIVFSDKVLASAARARSEGATSNAEAGWHAISGKELGLCDRHWRVVPHMADDLAPLFRLGFF